MMRGLVRFACRYAFLAPLTHMVNPSLYSDKIFLHTRSIARIGWKVQAAVLMHLQPENDKFETYSMRGQVFDDVGLCFCPQAYVWFEAPIVVVGFCRVHLRSRLVFFWEHWFSIYIRILFFVTSRIRLQYFLSRSFNWTDWPVLENFWRSCERKDLSSANFEFFTLYF